MFYTFGFEFMNDTWFYMVSFQAWVLSLDVLMKFISEHMNINFLKSSWNDIVLSKVCIIKYCFKIFSFPRKPWVSLSFMQDKDKQTCFNILMWFSKISINYMTQILSPRFYMVSCAHRLCFVVDIEYTPWQRFFRGWWTCPPW